MNAQIFAFPMSFAQERLWFLAQVEPDNPAYNLAAGLRLSGELDIDRVERCLAATVARHEALRTTFAVVEGQPTQMVRSKSNIRCEHIDLGNLDPTQHESILRQTIRRLAQQPFDLIDGPLLRVALLRVCVTEHVLVWVVHHMVFDGWSTGLVLREFARAYSALAANQSLAAAGSAPALHYADFAHWQRERAKAGRLQTSLDYWRERLTDLKPLLELPTDRPRPAVQRFQGARAFFTCLPTLTAQIKALAQTQGVTAYTVLLSAFKVLIVRYTGRFDVAVGTPVTHRNRAELEEIVGCFANTVVIRTELAGDLVVDEILQRVNAEVLNALAHQEVPFDQVVQALAPPRDRSYSPLVQVMFALQPQVATHDMAIPGLAVELLDLDAAGAAFDLSLELAWTGDHLSGAVEYDVALFDAATIERMIGHYLHLLGAMVDREKRLFALPMLSAGECAQITRWSLTNGSAAVTEVYPQIFARQVEKSPQALAVIDGADQLGYGELEQRVNQLAHLLRRYDLRGEERVAICLPRSVPAIVALLAVLRAGAAYVPIDPGLPASRIQEIFEQAAIRLAIVDGNHTPTLPAATTSIALDRQWQSIAQESSKRPLGEPLPEQLAYLIFTSGSTGVAKGVAVSHRALAAFVATSQSLYALSSRDRVLQFASLSFDASVEEIFPTLAVGATLVLRDDAMIETPAKFVAACAHHQLTVVDLPTMYWHHLLASQGAALTLPACVRLALIGGEAAMPEHLQAWQRASGVGHVRLVNTYGPTETTVTALAADLALLQARDRWAVAIGRPLIHASAWVLDREGQLVPPGVVGELYIGGDAVARGYWARANLTAERFVPDPFASVPGARLYRTGDLVRRRDNGDLEFVGRVDHQVKVRGFRLELGEIEARLLQVPNVRQAAVIVANQSSESARLIAYVAAPSDLQPHVLRQALRQHVPDYMVPASFVVLDTLPHNAQGKIDRQALPAPTIDQGGPAARPENSLQATLAGIWRELLVRPTLGIDDNFFELGGDSIVALQVVARVRELGFGLTLSQLFAHQNIRELAQVLTPLREVNQATARSGAIPLTPIQAWFFAKCGDHPHHWNQSLWVELAHDIDTVALKQAFAAIAERYDALFLRFAQRNGQWTQWHGEAPAFVFDQTDRRDIAPSCLGASLAEFASAQQSGLHLEHGPLLRLHLVDCPAPARPRLLLVAHHLIIDAVSWRILLGAWQHKYHELKGSAVAFTPAPNADFADWAQYLAGAREDPQVQASREFWQQQTASSPEELHIPLDNPQGCARESATTRLIQRLSPTDTQALLAVVSKRHLRIDEVLLTALALALRPWVAASRLIVDLESHGRDAIGDRDASQVVGWLTAVYPLALPLGNDDTPLDLLKRIRQSVRQAAGRASSYGILAAQHPGRGFLSSSPALAVNFLGHWHDERASSSLFAFCDDDIANERDPQGTRTHEVELDAALVGDALRLSWSYSHERLHHATVEQLGFALLTHLRRLCGDLGDETRSLATPSDFSLVELTPSQLDRLLVEHADLEDIYPLTPLQQGLLFHSLWAPGTGVYVEQVTCELVGPIDADAFFRAWQHVVQSHAILRSVFVWENADEPLQVVKKNRVLDYRALDWRDHPMDDGGGHRQALAAYLNHERACGFDLAKGPLMRLALVRTGATAHTVIWTHHHLLLDGWSAALLLGDAFAAYEALSQGRACEPINRRPFRDYVAWLARRDLSPAQTYWRQHLAGFSTATALPYDRGPQGDSGHAVESLVLSADFTANLQSFAQQQRVTAAILVQAAWALVLSKSARSRDVLFGLTVAGRGADLAGMNAMVGLFINALPLRVQINPALSVGAWLQQIFAQGQTHAAFEPTPLPRIRACSEVAAGQPLFETLLVFENYPGDPQRLFAGTGIEARALAFVDQTNYPLTLAVLPGEHLQLRLSFALSRLRVDDAKKILGLLEQALRSLIADPQTKVGDLSLVSPRALAKVCDEWNNTAIKYSDVRLIHQKIADHAQSRPDAIAVIFGEQRLKYSELEARANQLAHTLQRLGVGPDQLVAVCAHRSLEMVIALVAILKAGAAYVPIDPDYPAERIAYMLEDAAAAVLVSTWPVASQLPPHAAHVLCLDVDRRQIEREAMTAPIVALLPQHLAYAIYTSGSTGRPKGAANSHAGLHNRLHWMQQRYQLSANDRVLQKTPFSFDVSVWEFFWPLMEGATLVVARPGDHREPQRMIDLINRQAVTTLHFVPSMLGAFLETPEVSTCHSLRRVICSGEALPTELVRRFFECFPGVELHNLYGPTEASIDVSAWPCQSADAATGVPIGRPIANIQLYVLDPEGQLAPIGLAGELYIGGIGLARGYHRRSKLTAQRFVPDPFSRSPGARLYRTGDLCRYRNDGAIEYLGRLDHQVKIRGLRVELGEIEAHLLEHPGVREAVVVARREAHGGQRLVGYVSLRNDESSQPDAIRAWLNDRLPGYMVPWPIVVLPSLPLSPNGKIDRHALPEGDASTSLSRAYVAPSNDAERVLAEVWSQVLQRHPIGIHDDFFELGGDSIVTLQVIARAAQRGLRLSPRTLFEHPTIAQAAAQAQVIAPTRAEPITVFEPSSNQDLSAQEWHDVLEELTRAD